MNCTKYRIVIILAAVQRRDVSVWSPSCVQLSKQTIFYLELAAAQNIEVSLFQVLTIFRQQLKICIFFLKVVAHGRSVS